MCTLMQGWSHDVPLLALLCRRGLMASFPVLSCCCLNTAPAGIAGDKVLEQHLQHVSVMLL